MYTLLFLTILAVLSTGCLSETTPSSTLTEAPTTAPLSGGEDPHGIPIEFQNMVNPVSATQASIAGGSDLYTKNCASCHGPEGRGDGHMAMMLEHKPSNLHDAHVQENTDGSLFYFITEGVVEAKMPAFSKLSEEDRWNIVNYMRTFDVEEGEEDDHTP